MPGGGRAGASRGSVWFSRHVRAARPASGAAIEVEAAWFVGGRLQRAATPRGRQAAMNSA